MIYKGRNIRYNKDKNPGKGCGTVKKGRMVVAFLVCLLLCSQHAWAEEMTDQAFMDALTLAFMDGVKELTPDSPRAEIQAVMVKVPGKKIGSLQWFLDGVPQAGYYRSEFPIDNGRITTLDLSVPFAKGMENRKVTVALEVHLNGVIRRIEKSIDVRNYHNDWYDNQEKARVLSMVKPVEIEAEIGYWTHTYDSKYLKKSNGSLGKGSKVVYADHYGTSAAYIRIPEEDRYCWVPYASVKVSNKNYTVSQDYPDTDKEIFVNAKGYESKTDYLVWVNLERQKVNVFLGEKGNWDLIRTSTCSSGANITPTPTGIMTYCAYGNGWYEEEYIVHPVLYLDLERGIALHSILFNLDGTVQDATQGRPVSHGCIRMLKDEINWLASYLPIGTTVVVY